MSSAKNSDYEYLETSEEASKRGLRRITRPAFLGEPKRRENKKPITIMLDPDIIEHFKAQAESSRTGYQTLINQTLRDSIQDAEMADPIEKLLNNKKALKRLKTKLEAV
ncbi:MAG TPA: BrnA antitoxin family protein [Pyrinomonadaceae bacterium]|nr:BrnA antitoxin family protein [Acidobacteriota bacterium]HQZ96304.1 BrnA antitoxin family protein [Pyrinomonadaceae bacterium]